MSYKDPNNTNSVFNTFRDKFINNIIRIMTITKQILSTQ